MGIPKTIHLTRILYTHKNRFYWEVSLPDSNGCMIWKGIKTPNGYGKFHVNYKAVGAHRYSYKIHFGEIPEGMLVCHHCDNPPCVAPNHLFLGTSRDNMQDKIKKGRANNGKLGTVKRYINKI